MIYKINIDNDELDRFELESDNVGVVHVYDENGDIINSKVKVQIFLSKNAILGLGTELIRLAHNFNEGKHVHLEPAEKESLVQRLGIFLTPDSSEVIVCCSNSEKIDNYL